MKKSRLLGAVCAFLVSFSSLVDAAFLTTGYNSTNGHGGIRFQVDVLGESLLITALDINVTQGNPPTFDLEVYVTPSPDLLAGPGNWTLVSRNEGIVANGTDVPTPVDVTDFVLTGHMASALYITIAVSPGTPSGKVNATTWGNISDPINGFGTNDDLALYAGLLSAYPFSPPSGIAYFNGTIYYTPLSQVVPIPPALWLFGSGLLGLIGIARRKAAESLQYQLRFISVQGFWRSAFLCRSSRTWLHPPLYEGGLVFPPPPLRIRWFPWRTGGALAGK